MNRFSFFYHPVVDNGKNQNDQQLIDQWSDIFN
jgi:hypothetical protein